MYRNILLEEATERVLNGIGARVLGEAGEGGEAGERDRAGKWFQDLIRKGKAENQPTNDRGQILIEALQHSILYLREFVADPFQDNRVHEAANGLSDYLEELVKEARGENVENVENGDPANTANDEMPFPED